MGLATQHTNDAFQARVAVYARFSCDKQRDASIEDQIYEAQRYCERKGYEIVRVYPDYAISGRSDDRPQFLQMIEDAKSRAFNVVLVWKMDRFARNMQDQFYYEKMLADSGVRLESVKENIAGNGIEASLSKGMHAIFAQIRSQQSAEDTMRGMLGKARKCQYLGSWRYGYTHDGDEITIDPATAPIAREIHTRYLAGESQQDILAWLRSLDVRGLGGRPVGKTFVTGVLKSEMYAGVYQWGYVKDDRGNAVLDSDGNRIPLVRVEGGVPAIVTPDEKDRCLRRLRYRKHVNAKADYMLSGKLYCLDCGLPMHGETCKNHEGIEFWRYCCQGKRKACSGIYWKDRTEEAIAKTIRDILTNQEVVDLIADGFERYRSKKKPDALIEAVKDRMKTIRKKRDHLLKAVEDGMPYKHVMEKMDKLDAQQEAAEKKLEELERSQCEITRTDVLRFLELVAKGMRSNEDLLKAFVSQVWVSGDYAVAIMNFTGQVSEPYETRFLLQKKLEPAGKQQVRDLNDWLPYKSAKTNSHLSVTILDNGIGFLISLKAA